MGKQPVPDPRGCVSQRLAHGQIERTWYDQPWLDYAGHDRPVRKGGFVDLDPLGGANNTTAISLQSTQQSRIIIRTVDITPLDQLTRQGTTIVQRINDAASTTAGVPINWTSGHDVTVSPAADVESEHAIEQFFWVPPGRVWNLVFTNESVVNRARLCFSIEYKISRIADDTLIHL